MSLEPVVADEGMLSPMSCFALRLHALKLTSGGGIVKGSALLTRQAREGCLATAWTVDYP